MLTSPAAFPRLNTTVAPLLYADQFLQMSTSLASPFLYGLAEHRSSFLQDVQWTTLSLWARDVPPMVWRRLLARSFFSSPRLPAVFCQRRSR